MMPVQGGMISLSFLFFAAFNPLVVSKVTPHSEYSFYEIRSRTLFAK